MRKGTTPATTTTTTYVPPCCPGVTDLSKCPVCAEGEVCDGTRCMDISECPCKDGDVMKKASSVWKEDSGCTTCMCLNGEVDCVKTTCPELSCNEGEEAIKAEGECCPSCKATTCSPTEVTCPADGKCIPQKWWCDGTPDCSKGEDEKDCIETTPPPTTTMVRTTRPTVVTTTPAERACWYNNQRYSPGDERSCGVGDCEKCVCSEDYTWDCNKELCKSATCVNLNEGFETFDGCTYNYEVCSHFLAKDCAEGSFEVRVNRQCEPSGDKQSCRRWLEVNVGKHEFVLRGRGESIIYCGREYSPAQISVLNWSIPDLDIACLNGQISITSKKGFSVYWCEPEARVVVDQRLRDKTCGLCGVYNERTSDDLMTKTREITTNVERFGTSWVASTDRTCEPPPERTCLSNPLYASQAEAACKILMNQYSVFAPCHSTVTPDMYYQQCLESVCGCCEEGNTVDECSCHVFESYARTCGLSGCVLNWRSPVRCPITCPYPQVYKECVPGCPRTCDNMYDDHLACDIQCTSGCFCPDDMVLRGGICVKPEQCTDCFCFGFGDPHYVTFDGVYYPYQGNCSYVAACTPEFEIIVDNEICRMAPDTSCTKAITVKYGGIEITMMDGIRLNVNGVPTTLPYELKGMRVMPAGWQLILTIDEFNLEVRYDEMNHGFVIMMPQTTYKDRTKGLCGTCNNDPRDEFKKRNGEIATSEVKFAYDWRVAPAPGEKCWEPPQVTVPTAEPGCAEDSVCDILLTDVFKDCHPVIPVESYYLSCKFDVCHGTDKCNSLTAYGQVCSRKGVCMDWRSDSLCPSNCVYPKTYKMCGPAIPRTCENYNNYDSIMASCTQLPAEGCFCPDGTVWSNNNCVAVSECPVCTDDTGAGRKIGDSWVPHSTPCSTCECMGPNNVQCTPKECPEATRPTCPGGREPTEVRDAEGCCSSWSCDCYCSGFSSRFTTFDGTCYDFDGKCTYVLARSRNYDFEITIDTNKAINVNYRSQRLAVGGADYPCVTSGGNRVDLRQNRLLSFDNEAYAGYTGGQIVFAVRNIGLEVRVDPVCNTFSIKVPAAAYFDQTEGLCGTCNSNAADDFSLRNRIVTSSVTTFGNDWQVNVDDADCRPPAVPTSPPACENELTRSCETILSGGFKSCHDFVNPESYYQACINEVCGKSWKTEDGWSKCPSCAAIAAYAAECRKCGSCVDWRRPDFCPYTCESGFEYSHCSQINQETCDGNLMPADLIQDTYPVEGCFCPAGMVLQGNTCVVPEECPVCKDSSGNGRKMGEVWRDDADSCKMCQCTAPDCVVCSSLRRELPAPSCPEGTLEEVQLGCITKYECRTRQCGPCSEPQSIECQPFEDVQSTPIDECCNHLECVCNPANCPSVSIPFCDTCEKLVTINEGSCCPVKQCVCDTEECPPTAEPMCARGEVAIKTEGKCSSSWSCVCRRETCATSVPVCGYGEETECVDPDACCPEYRCVCRPENCPSLTCAEGYKQVKDSCCSSCECDESQCTVPEPVSCDFSKGYTLQKTGRKLRAPGAADCCPEHEEQICVCEPSTCSPVERPTCTGYQMCVQTNAGECCPEYSCVCDKNKCPDQRECRSYETRVEVGFFDPDTCCCPKFECRTSGCVDSEDNRLPVGHMYTPSDAPCSICECMSDGNIRCRPKNCPVAEVPACPAGQEAVSIPSADGCCKEWICDDKVCHVAVVEPAFLEVGNCRSMMAVNVTKCEGKCTSQSLYSAAANNYEKQCSCCSAVQTTRRAVEMVCSDGSNKTHYMDIVINCGCNASQCEPSSAEPGM
ncbi:von Willebrand factor-like [Branchiostoma floridae]|uniref:von Willebrand factor-like n=1 Tax=Branchiostoma floridae TaxID=7739 RepID=A0A9J7HK42_BRAFL|nr:von Willebrand factor-like [Branchiostoma floridae]